MSLGDHSGMKLGTNKQARSIMGGEVSRRDRHYGDPQIVDSPFTWDNKCGVAVDVDTYNNKDASVLRGSYPSDTHPIWK